MADEGFGEAQLAEMQCLIDAENSDLFDVLAYQLPPVTREERANRVQVAIRSGNQFNISQQAFLDFVLAHYVSVDVTELNGDKLTPLIRLKYHDSLKDGLADLGGAPVIHDVFAKFQQYLYANQP